VEALLGPKTEADLVKPDKRKKAKPAAAAAAAAGAAENGGAAAGAAAAGGKKGAGEEAGEAWRSADPYAFLPKPQQNNMVHTTVHFRCGAR
jgi:glutaminyl-tRNA synthetase